MKKNIACIYCGKNFRHRHRLFRHMTDKHLVYCPEGSVIVTLDFLRLFLDEDECDLNKAGTFCHKHVYMLDGVEPCPQQELKDILGDSCIG